MDGFGPSCLPATRRPAFRYSIRFRAGPARRGPHCAEGQGRITGVGGTWTFMGFGGRDA
jgi:hypothetical protein